MPTTEALGNPTCPAEFTPLFVTNLFAAPAGLDRMGAVKASTRQRAFELCQWSANQGRPLHVLWGKVSNPNNTEHYGGYGVDFMTFSNAQLSKHDRAIGDGIVEYVLKNRDRLKVRGVIWRQRRIGYSSGWANWVNMADRGTSTANHYDHVHILFEAADYVPPAPTGPTYVVRAGDTLTKIAAAHGLTSWQALAALNPGIDPNAIKVGQVLNVPAKPEPKPEPPVRFVVVSTNMQDATMASSKDHPWAPRKAGYISAVKSAGPDVILVQEATRDQLADLGTALGFNWWRSEDTTRATDSTPDKGPLGVLWNPKVLERTGDGREKELYSNRRVLRVPLKHKESGREFDAAVSHLDNGAGVANVRDRQAKEVAEWLPGDPKPTEDSPLVFGWDANDKRRTSGPRKILNDVGIVWVRDAVKVTNAEYESHHGYGTLSKGVEWIDDLGARGMKILRAGMVRTDKGAPVKEHRNVTDHNILWMEVQLTA